MPATDYLRSKLYNHIFRNVAYTSPASLFLEWCKDTTVPNGTVGGAGTPSTAGRSALAMNDDGGDGIGDNTSQVAVTGVPAGNYPYVEIWDASTAGNRLFYATAAAALSFAAPGIAYVDAGALIASVMGSNGTDTLRNLIYDHIFRNTTFTPPTAWYTELCTSATTPTSATAGTPSGVARQATTFAADAGSLGTGANSNLLTFAAVAAATYSYAETWDASTAGRRLTFGTLAAAILMSGSGDITFPIGNIVAAVL